MVCRRGPLAGSYPAAVALVAQGLCTSLMLIAAVPPLVTGWPTGKLPFTGMIMNLCVFGAVAAGPSVGEMPVRQLATTLRVSAVLVVMCAGSAAFGLTEIVLTALRGTSRPAHVALLFLPEFGAAVLTAVLFGALFRTRFTPLLAIGGLVMLVAAAALLAGLDPKAPDRDVLVAAGSGLIGLGVGASVSPALFITGFSLRSVQVQRVFALVELLRGVTAFLGAPLLLYLATAIGSSPMAGDHATVWICLAIAAGGALVATVVFLLGGGRLQTPDLERWNGGEPAWTSPPLAGRLSGGFRPARAWIAGLGAGSRIPPGRRKDARDRSGRADPGRPRPDQPGDRAVQ